jgi:hypothetical protein
VGGVPRQRDDPLAARVAQGGGSASLTLRAVPRLALSGDDLQRDVEAAPFVAGEPYVAHPSCAERPERPVAAEEEVVLERSRRHSPFLRCC